MKATFKSQKAEILKKYAAIIQDQVKVDLVEKLLRPCINCKVAIAGKSGINSKIGGNPLLPKAFTLPEWKNQKLVFLCQIDFKEIKAQDHLPNLPKEGLLSIFGYFKNEANQLTIPEKDKNQLVGFYFEDVSKLEEVDEDAIKLRNLREIKIEFYLYADIPEFGDYRLPDQYININPDFKLTWEIIPKVFDEQLTPAMKLLGYPTDDALNTYLSWLLKDKEREHSEKIFESEKSNYELLLWIDLLQMKALELENEYSEFGGISIGIRREDLERRNFEHLLFKYTMS